MLSEDTRRDFPFIDMIFNDFRVADERNNLATIKRAIKYHEFSVFYRNEYYTKDAVKVTSTNKVDEIKNLIVEWNTEFKPKRKDYIKKRRENKKLSDDLKRVEDKCIEHQADFEACSETYRYKHFYITSLLF